MNKLIEFFVKKHLFANLLTLLLFIFGIFSLMQTRREMFPNVKFDIVQIKTIYPGASPEEVEKLIINPLEQDLREVDGIKKMQSYAREGAASITLTVDPDQATELEVKEDVQDVVDQFSDLPEGAEDPTVSSMETKKAPVIEVTVSGEQDPLKLRSIAREIETEIEEIKEVAKVVANGLRDKEVLVTPDPRKLARYKLSLDDLIHSLKSQNLSIPGGILEISAQNPDGKERLVRTVGEFENIADVENTVLRSNELGRSLLVKDVATVQYTLEKAELLNKTDGLASINLTVLKKEKADAINLVEKVKKRVAELQIQYAPEIKLNLVNDTSVYIIRRLNVLRNNLSVGLLLVLLILCLLLPGRVALLVSLGIPFAFLGAMIIFYTQSLSINLISMIGLIIVAGMLVDDAVIVMDNAFRFMEKGHDPQTAAIKGTQQIWPAVTASVSTTICVFVPMLLMTGIFGKFVKQIPLGVMIPLAISLVEVFFIMPAHIASWIKMPNKTMPQSGIKRALKKSSEFWDKKIVPSYINGLRKILRIRYICMSFVFAIFVGSIVFAYKKMDFILFPPEGIEQFFIRASTPVGSSLTQTAEAMLPLEKKVSELSKSELKNFVTLVGAQMQDPNDPNQQFGTHVGQIAIFLTPESQRERNARAILEDLRERIGTVEGLERLSFDEVNPGPPVGKPIDISIRGKEYPDILKLVNRLKEYLAEQEGVSDIVDSFVEGKEEVHIKVNASEAAAAGLTVAQIGQTVRAAYEGIVATRIQELNDEVDVRVRFPKQIQSDISVLENLKIPNPQGFLIALKNIARLEKTRGISSYSHEDGERQVRVTAMLDTQVTNTRKIMPIIEEEMNRWLEQDHPGISFKSGGESEDTEESMQSLFRAFALSIALIVLILVFLFQNLLQPLLVLLVIPLGIISAIASFYLHGLPLSFMGMLGIIALGGVIVNNAIVFIDFVNQKRKEGKDLIESIIDTARIRARPIFLTSVTTVCGLLPTAYGIGGMDRFVRPIALSLGWGLVVGSFLTLFVIPTSIAIMDDITQFFGKFKKKKTPVEPQL